MTASPSDPFFVSYAIAVDVLEQFEDKHPPEWLIAQFRQCLTEVAAYSLTDSGRLAGCRGVCLAHSGLGRPGPRAAVLTCPRKASCPAGQQLAHYDNILHSWTYLRTRVREARRVAGLLRPAEGRKKT